VIDKKIKLKVLCDTEAKRFLRNIPRTKCMYKQCSYKPIDSHCFQRSMLEKRLSDEEGMVYCWTINGVAQGIRRGEETFFSKEHINKSGVFKGFCGERHDSQLFRLIEVKDYVEEASLEEYSFLYAYRNLCHFLWEVKTTLTNSDDIFEKYYSNPVIEDCKAFLKTKIDEMIAILFKGVDLKKYENLKDKFENYILEDGTVNSEIVNEFKIFTYPIEKEIFFASLACKELRESNYPISLGLIPQFQNKPSMFYIISHKEDSNVFDELVGNSKNSGFFMQNIVLKCTSNTIIHPKLFMKLESTGELEKFKKFISHSKYQDMNQFFGFNFFVDL
jgi:hypothetical protein